MSTLGGIGFRPFDQPTAARTVLTALSWPKGLMTAAGAVVNGTVPVQIDVMKRWGDGSVRHALAAVRVPALAMGQWAHGGLEPAAALTGTPIQITTDVVVTIKPAGGSPVVIDLQTAINGVKLEPWRTGPLVTEARAYIPIPELSPDFELIADVACFSDGTPTRVDLGFSRSLVDIGTAAPTMTANLAYDVTITSGGQSVSYSLDGGSFIATVDSKALTATVIGAVNGLPALNATTTTLRADGYYLEPTTQLTAFAGGVYTLNHARYDGVFGFSTGLTHALGQVWWHTVNEQPVHVVQDVDMLRRAGVMIHRRDLGIVGIPAPVWPLVKPLDSGDLTKYFPSTGDHEEIGDIPHYDAEWIISQDPGAYLNALPEMRAFSAVPWHLRDRVSGKWLGAHDFPNTHSLTLSQNNGWSPDSAHSGCYNAVPWVLTGRRMWLDDLEAQVGASQMSGFLAPIVVSWPGNPPFTESQFEAAITSFQTRGQAWTLRTLLMGAAFIPDNRPMASYMPGIIEANVKAMRDYMAYATPLQGQLGLWNQAFAEGAPFGQVAGWTEGYFLTVLCWLNRLGYDVKDILAAKAKFFCGPFMGLGMPANQGACYQTVVYDAAGKPIQNWADAWVQRQAAQAAGQGNVDISDQTVNGDATYWSIWYGASRLLVSEISDAGAQATVDYIDATKTPTNSLRFCVDTDAQWNPKFAQLV